MQITSFSVSDIQAELNTAAKKGELIKIEQRYLGKAKTKTYRYRTGFPYGLKAHSVTGWFSTDFKYDGLFMSSTDFANYLSTVISGQGGLHISYSVERISPVREISKDFDR